MKRKHVVIKVYEATKKRETRRRKKRAKIKKKAHSVI